VGFLFQFSNTQFDQRINDSDQNLDRSSGIRPVFADSCNPAQFIYFFDSVYEDGKEWLN
jgi:hypothetical protein